MKKVKIPYLMLQWDHMKLRRSVSLLGFIYPRNIQHHTQGKNLVYVEMTGVSVIENANLPKLDCLRKDVTAIFYNEGLKITISGNLTTMDFLDVTLEIFTGKSSNSLLYVNVNSNQARSIRQKNQKRWKHNQQFETTRRNKTALDSTKLAIFRHFQLCELAL